MAQPILRKKTYDLDWHIAVAAGLVDGYAVVNKFGQNGDVDQSEEDIWDGGGTYNWITAASGMQVSSSSAADAAAGSGAQTMQVEGLDSNWAAATATYTLNGQTAVTGATTFNRVYRAKVLTAGSTEANVGTIYVSDNGSALSSGAPTASTVIRAQIGATNGQTLMAVYTVPASKTGYVVGYYASIGGGSPVGVDVDHVLKVRVDASTGTAPVQVKHAIGTSIDGGNPVRIAFDAPIIVTEKSDVWIASTSSSDNAIVHAGFELILKDN